MCVEAVRGRVGTPWPTRVDAGFTKARRGVRIHAIGVGPVFVYAVPRIEPVVEHLTAERMAPDAPSRSVSARMQMLVTDKHIVEVLYLERDVIEPGLVAANDVQHVMVHVLLAAIDAVERTDDVAGLIAIHLIGA